MAIAVKSNVPGPTPRPIVGNIPEFIGDPIPFLLGIHEKYGEIAHYRVGMVDFYSLANADDVQYVLVKGAKSFTKPPRMRLVLGKFMGNGLVLSEGDFWKRQRKLAQPAFHAQRIANYAGVMVEYTQNMLDTWQPGETRDICKEMMGLTLRIVTKTLFDADVSGHESRVEQALVQLLELSEQEFQYLAPLPQWIPTPHNLRVRRATGVLDDVLNKAIAERRAAKDDRGDLLSMLMMAQDEDGVGMTDKQLRDETMTLFLAGHETTSNALTWTWYLLSQHPDVRETVQAELERVLGGRAPTFADVRELTYTEQVIKESMRVYPPVWNTVRYSTEDVELAGYRIPKDSIIVISPMVLHHNPKYWENPEQFDPDRFSPENEDKVEKYAYIPFSAGPRVCIGNSFAMMEAVLILATVLQRFDLDLDPTQAIDLEPIITLRPRYGLRMQVRSNV